MARRHRGCCWIDRSRSCPRWPPHQRIGAEADSEATVGLAHGLARQVVAEGVETEAQHAFLARLGCHEAQGYLYGAAAEARAVAALARQAR